MPNTQIVAEVAKKRLDGSFDTYYLGPEQRYSGALPSSNNNNLEEQLLMDVDKVVTKTHDPINNVDVIVTEFKRESDTNNYYVLRSTVTQANDIFVDENGVIHFGDGTHMAVGEHETMVETEFNSKIFYDPTVETLETYPEQGGEVHKLFFKNSLEEEVPVSTKTVTRETTTNGVSIKEVITRDDT